ncbi:Hypothetical protein HVR_LOCUS775 [uncultured virus]|nr:Hypothetical protein HVR_LOCUS775 [uncultured virus]
MENFDTPNVEIIETMRMDNVINIIKEALTKNELDEGYLRDIFGRIYYDNNGNMKVHPQNLIYDSKKVHAKLEKLIENILAHDPQFISKSENFNGSGPDSEQETLIQENFQSVDENDSAEENSLTEENLEDETREFFVDDKHTQRLRQNLRDETKEFR